jgi:Calcium/calmodulin dependent protein kinase II association domain
VYWSSPKIPHVNMLTVLPCTVLEYLSNRSSLQYRTQVHVHAATMQCVELTYLCPRAGCATGRIRKVTITMADEARNLDESTLLRDDDVIALNQSLLNAIARIDYATYDVLCSNDMTCFEPESNNILVEGKAFHKFYFDLPRHTGNDKGDTMHDNVQTNVTMANVHVRRIGLDVAIVAYVRLDQCCPEGQVAMTRQCSETRVWERCNLHWRCVHVHRS